MNSWVVQLSNSEETKKVIQKKQGKEMKQSDLRMWMTLPREGGDLILADGNNLRAISVLLPFLIIYQVGMIKFQIRLST